MSKRNFYFEMEGVYVKKILLPCGNIIGKTSECYVLSVITCSTPIIVHCTSISVNFEKIKVIIYESIHFKRVITFIPYSLSGHGIRELSHRQFKLVGGTRVFFRSLLRGEIEEGRRLVEVDEVATLLHQPTLLSYDSEVGDMMNAHEYPNYEMGFDLNNPYEPTDDEFLDMCSS
jgi:hypothetical protein